MSQSENAEIGKIANVISDESYCYIGVQSYPYALSTTVFGLNSAEVSALYKRFPKIDEIVTNGVAVKGSPFSVMNALAELGYRVVCSTRGVEILWTMQREL